MNEKLITEYEPTHGYLIIRSPEGFKATLFKDGTTSGTSAVSLSRTPRMTRTSRSSVSSLTRRRTGCKRRGTRPSERRWRKR